MKKILLISFPFFLGLEKLPAQNPIYKDVDAKTVSFGTLSTFNIATITDTITADITGKKEKVRAIFYWIANNISIDPKATKSNDHKKTDPVTVMQTRSTTSFGFSLLFQEMCSLANIRCLTVDGYIKRNANEIGDPPDEPNHSWNVVQLSESPSEWYYVDAAMAAGYLDKKMTLFTKSFRDEYFFSNKSVFNRQHFPDNQAWMLGDGGSRSLKDFYANPIICTGAYESQLLKYTPANGLLKTNTEKKLSFTLTFNQSIQGPIQVIYGEGSKQSKPERVNITENGNEIRFDYLFKKSDTYPFYILIGDQELISYWVEVE